MVNIPMLSVIMPAYNAELYIDDAIVSILSQTLQDFEFLIIDDGSSDSTLNIIQSYADKDKRIKFWKRDNRGIVYTLNELVALSSGEYIARMDADDISHPDRLEKQLSEMRKNPQCVILGSWIELIGDKNGIWHYRKTHEETVGLSFFGRACLSHPSLMLKKGLLEKIKYRPEYEYIEDLDFLLNAINSELGEIYALPEVLLDYRVYDSSVCGSKKEMQRNLRQKRNLEYLAEHNIYLSENEARAFYRFTERLPPHAGDKGCVISIYERLSVTNNFISSWLKEEVTRRLESWY